MARVRETRDRRSRPVESPYRAGAIPMKVLRALPATCLIGLLTMAGAAIAETKVEVTKVHLCCKACVKGVATALKDVAGVKGECDQKNGTVTLTAADDQAAQK